MKLRFFNPLVLALTTVVTTVLPTNTAHSFSLELVQRFDASDANMCGDYNALATFKISEVGTQDIFLHRSQKLFDLNPKNFAVISNTIRDHFPTNTVGNRKQYFALVARHQAALELLKLELRFQWLNGKPHLGSCQPEALLSHLGLAVNNQALIMGRLPADNYLTISELRRVDASGPYFHVVVDLDLELLHIFHVM